MLDPENPSVLSYARVSARGATVIVSLNMSPRAQTLSLGLAQAGLRGTHLRTLMSSPQPHEDGVASGARTLPPYAAWVAELR